MKRTSAAPVTFAGLLLGVPHFAHAQSGYSIETVADSSHDSNLLRRDENLPPLPPGAPCRGDDIGRLQARLTGVVDGGDWSATVSGGPYREVYSCNRYLDFTGYEVFGALQRRSSDPLSITLNFIGLRQRSSFADVRVVAGNVQNFARATGEVALAVTPEIRIIADPRFVASTNENALFRSADYHSFGASVGIGWFTPLDNSIAMKVSRTFIKGLGPRLISLNNATVDSPIDLTDSAIGAEITYHPSVLTRLDGSLFYVRRRDTSVLYQNYRGLTGSLKVVYTPHELLTISAEAGRRLSNIDFLFIDAVRDDYFDAEIVKRIDHNSEIGAKLGYENQQFRYNFVLNASQGASFRRTILELTADTQIVDGLKVRATLRREWGQGTISYPTYKDTVVGIQLSYKFGNLR